MGVHLLTFTITDAGGKSKAFVLPMADTEAIADIQAFVTATALAVDDCIGGIISSAQVAYALTLPGGLNATPVDDRLVNQGGLLAFAVTGSDYRTSSYLPTVVDALVGNNRDIENSGDMATLITALLATGSITLTDKHENPLASFLKGTRVNRK